MRTITQGGIAVGRDNKTINSKQLASLNREALYTAATAAQTSNFALLKKMGVEETCYDLLRSVTLRALDRMTDFPAPLVDVSFNGKALSYFLNHQELEHSEETDTDRAIRLGIRQPMLNALTGISRRDYDQRKQALGLPPQERGRIESLTESEELDALRQWEQLKNSNLSELRKLCSLSESTGIGIDRLWNTIMEGI